VTERYILFITNQSKVYLREFYDAVKAVTQYKTEFILYEDLQSDYIMNILKTVKPADIIIVCCYAFYKEVEKELSSFFYTVFGVWFYNIICMCENSDQLCSEKVRNGEQYCLPLSATVDFKFQADAFNLYAINLFEKVLIQERLNDYICNSFKEVVYSELLSKKNKSLKILNENLESKNKVDHLTTLLNKTALNELLNKELVRAARDKWRLENSALVPVQKKENKSNMHYVYIPKGELSEHLGVCSLLLIEINQFIQINGQFGFAKGDEVLITFGRMLNSSELFRQIDIVGRFGDAIFYVVLPSTSSDNALIPASRLLGMIDTWEIFDAKQQKIEISISIGISESQAVESSCAPLLQRAQKALDNARQGKDRIVII